MRQLKSKIIRAPPPIDLVSDIKIITIKRGN
jgi:hypothetical protein